MRSGFRIGRIFGININIDWSWLLIFVLVSWNLSLALGGLHPEWNLGLRWGVALGAALIFFASVLAHELAHSLMARATGVPVRSITLFLFGGVSNIQREPPSPLAEFLITIVGPLTSFAIGGGFLLWAQFVMPVSTGMMADPSAALAQFSPLATMLLWLGSVNVLVGLFNLIPGYPLDGGRVLRSLLWKLTNNLRRATLWASLAGQGIAWLMILGGIAMAFGLQVPFFGTGLGSGIWLAFVGWFLNTAAVQGYQQVVVQEALEDVPVMRLMQTDPMSVAPDLSVDRLANDFILGIGEDTFPVMAEGRVIGAVTLDNLRNLPREEWPERTVRDIMTPYEELPHVGPDEDASTALNLLRRNEVRQLLVVKGQELAGILRRRDIVRWLQVHTSGA